MNDQLALDLDAAMPSREELLEADLRALVAEEGMTEAEVDAVVADALGNGGRTRSEDHGPAEPPICQCDRPLEMPNGWLATTTCARCGRWPRGGR